VKVVVHQIVALVIWCSWKGGVTRAAAIATCALVCVRGDVLVGVVALRSRAACHFLMHSRLAEPVGMMADVTLLCTLGNDGCVSMEHVILLLSSVWVADTLGSACTLGICGKLGVCTRSVLQEQRWNNQGQAVQVKKAELEKETYLLPETNEKPIVQVDEGRNCYPTSFNLVSLVLLSKNHEKILPGTSLFHPEASVNQPNQVKEYHVLGVAEEEQY